MEIKSGFYLRGFTRIDKGEAGALFVRYRKPKSMRGKMECICRHDAEEIYTISIPSRPRPIECCAIVTRTSKNCYQATVCDERRIEYLKADTLDGLRRMVAGFFEGAKS